MKENIKYLEEYENKIENSIEELKKLLEKINKDKEDLKLNIQKIFTKMRNILNNREDELLIEVENKFNEIYFKEEIIKNSETIPKKIKKFLDIGKKIDNEWNENNKLRYLINDCINLENNIKIREEINNKIENHKNINHKFTFTPLDTEINDFSNKLKKFGSVIVDG